MSLCSTTSEPLTPPDEEEAPATRSRAAWLSRLVGQREIAHGDTYRKLIAELWGTFVLVFVGIGALHVVSCRAIATQRHAAPLAGTIVVLDVPNWEHGGSLQIALTFGFGVTVGVWTVAPISGGCVRVRCPAATIRDTQELPHCTADCSCCRHLNPAVSFGFLVIGEMPLVRFLLYVVAQLAGSSMACGALRLALPEHYFEQVNVNGSNFNFGVTLPSSTGDYKICRPCSVFSYD